MHIHALLEEKGTRVAAVRRDATVGEVVAELARHRVGALVVSEDGSVIEGIVSERDVVRRMNEVGPAVLDEPVSAIMSVDVFTCSPDDDTESLMRTMTDRRIRHVPVVRGGRLAGIVSIGDVVKVRIGDLERDRTELLDYINAR
jgi:CBS domain-containing protein